MRGKIWVWVEVTVKVRVGVRAKVRVEVIDRGDGWGGARVEGYGMTSRSW